MQNLREFIHKTNMWDMYNGFFLMNDNTRLRKFMVREHFFKEVLEIPGDIVELGVFKGTGMSQLIKLRDILIPTSNKKVIGFDLFQTSFVDESLKNFYQQSDVDATQRISQQEVDSLLKEMTLSQNYLLIEGDVQQTIPQYLENNPGFRISFLYFDMDIEEPTRVALELLYDRVVRGGVIVFDEYACDKWTESNAVDKFLDKHPDIKLKTLTWAHTPTAYFIK